jgi:hypothetical protein
VAGFTASLAQYPREILGIGAGRRRICRRCRAALRRVAGQRHRRRWRYGIHNGEFASDVPSEASELPALLGRHSR